MDSGYTRIAEDNNLRDAFIDALNAHVDLDTDHTAHELYLLCGALWNDSAEMPIDERFAVRDAIGSWVEADEWEKNGRTFSGAARRIRPTLKAG